MKRSIIKQIKSRSKQVWKDYGTDITYLAVMTAMVGIVPDIASAASSTQGFGALAAPLEKGMTFIEDGIGPLLLGGGVAKAAYQHFTEQQSQGYKGAIAACVGGAGCLNAESIVDGVFGKGGGCIFF